MSGTNQTPVAGVADRIGLDPATDFDIAHGEHVALGRAAGFYFAREWVAVPRTGVPVAGFASGIDAFDDVRRWVASGVEPASAHPPLVWVAAPMRARGTRLAPDAQTVALGTTTLPFRPTPKFHLNRSYFDATSAAYLAQRPLSVRGEIVDGAFVARTLWPEDFRVDASAPLVPLPAAASVQLALRAVTREEPNGGARSPFAARVLWERAPGQREWAGKPALVVLVNGAQGDDDEAWGGHFACGAGFMPADGSIADFVVHNFYSLDTVSEKAILPAPVTLDNYLADLNSGQAWYRPSHLVVAVLHSPRVANRIQGAFGRVMQQFWRHQLPYHHSTMNCASISVDTLRALGWNVPARGPANRLLAWLSIPYAVIRYRSLARARIAYEYMTEDQTRLFPAATFEDAVADLLRLAGSGARPDEGEVASMLAADLEAIVLLRIPQLPSSRKFGFAAVATPREWVGTVPQDPELAQIVPVPPRPFPAELRDPDLLPPPKSRANFPMLVWGLAAVSMLVALVGLAARYLAPP